MILKRFHKWLFSIALIVSVVSVNGFTNSTDSIAKINTELIVSKKPLSKCATFYVNTKNVASYVYSDFSFNSFLIDSNSRLRTKINAANKKSLEYLNPLQSKIVYHSYYRNENETSS